MSYEDSSYDEPLTELLNLDVLEIETEESSQDMYLEEIDEMDVSIIEDDELSENTGLANIEDHGVHESIRTTLDDYEYEEINSADESYIDDAVKGMVTDVQDIIAQAKYVITASPTDGNYEGVSSLIVAGSSLVKELNKSIILKRRSNQALKLEKMRIDSRHKLEKLKMEKGMPGITGSGNTINIQNNNQQQTNISNAAGPVIEFSAEDIIKRLTEAELKNKSEHE